MPLKLEPGDVLYGGKLAPWKQWWVRIVQEVIKAVTHGKTHVMLVLYEHKQTPIPDDYIIFEYTWPRATWKVITQIPESYTVHRNPDGFKFKPTDLRRYCQEDNDDPYDVKELLEFLKGLKVVKGLSGKWFVCSTGVQHIMRQCGYDPWPDKSAVPKDFGNWPEVKEA